MAVGRKSKQFHEIRVGAKCPTPTQIVQFLEDFRRLAVESTESKSVLISIKIPEGLLRAFRLKAEQEGARYQTRIKELMRAYVLTSSEEKPEKS